MSLSRIPSEWLKPDPVLPLPTRAAVQAALQAGPEAIARLETALRNRAESIALRKADPLHYGFEPDCWGDFRRLCDLGFDEIYVTGANREGKTTLLVKYILQQLFGRKCEWAMFHNTERTSIAQQQKMAFGMFPPELRQRILAKAIKRGAQGQSAYLQYNEATGFSNQVFILPETGSSAFFFNYGQSTSVWEGPEYDGMYFDEQVTLSILETSRYRRGKGRRLQLLVNFTPKWGFTPVVQNMLTGSTIVETRPAALLAPDQVHVKGCPPGHMPYIMHGARPRSAIIFFHNRMNPLGAGAEILSELTHAPKSRIMIRGYGFAEKSASGAFPKFGAAHIVKRARFAEILARGGTIRLVADGAGGRNWMLQWWLATPQGHHILFREWPDRQRYEEWALSPGEAAEDESEASNRRRHDWRIGPAQRLDAGRSLGSYVALILETEGWHWDAATRTWKDEKAEKLAQRIMDPRFGGWPVPTEEEGVTIIDRLATKGNRDSQGREVPPMEFDAAPGGGTVREDTVQLLSDAIDWDESQPLTHENCPRLYVHEDCLQAREAFTEYVAPPQSTEKNALKDIIDCARYYMKSDCHYIDPKRVRARKGGFW